MENIRKKDTEKQECMPCNAISIEEIPREKIDEFWDLHWEYLNRDIFPFESLCPASDEEDKEYFKGEEYRGTMESYMKREPDKAHMIYFVKENVRIGCAEYVTYKSEDGKCFLMDFWVFPDYRGNGMGHACYECLRDYVVKDGATYFEINVSNEKNQNFWKSNGFFDAGVDEWGMPLMKSRKIMKLHF